MFTQINNLYLQYMLFARALSATDGGPQAARTGSYAGRKERPRARRQRIGRPEMPRRRELTCYAALESELEAAYGPT